MRGWGFRGPSFGLTGCKPGGSGGPWFGGLLAAPVNPKKWSQTYKLPRPAAVMLCLTLPWDTSWFGSPIGALVAVTRRWDPASTRASVPRVPSIPAETVNPACLAAQALSTPYWVIDVSPVALSG